MFNLKSELIKFIKKFPQGVNESKVNTFYQDLMKNNPNENFSEMYHDLLFELYNEEKLIFRLPKGVKGGSQKALEVPLIWEVKNEK